LIASKVALTTFSAVAFVVSADVATVAISSDLFMEKFPSFKKVKNFTRSPQYLNHLG
jgi:hypothetical protein